MICRKALLAQNKFRIVLFTCRRLLAQNVLKFCLFPNRITLAVRIRRLYVTVRAVVKRTRADKKKNGLSVHVLACRPSVVLEGISQFFTVKMVSFVRLQNTRILSASDSGVHI